MNTCQPTFNQLLILLVFGVVVLAAWLYFGLRYLDGYYRKPKD